jgi:D-tyrosyl-tRNA(Tyr) deacylase
VRVVLQRVSRAEVRIDGRVTGRIGRGHVLLVGFESGDGTPQIDWMADKVLGLRVFADGEGKMNLGLEEAGGDLLVVSQFTLYGDVSKGRRPSFVRAAPPEVAEALYEELLRTLRSKTARAVESGEFGAMMEVDLVNDGPVTLVLERD